MKKNIYVMLWGGFGDVLLSTPLFKEFKLQNPEATIVALCRHTGYKSVLSNNPHIDIFRKYNFFFKCYYKFLERLKIIKIRYINYGSLIPGYTYKKSATEIIAEMAGINLKDFDLQIYLTEQEDLKAKATLAAFSKPTVIINITSKTSKNQMWPVENWNELVRTTPDFTFIQLGLTREHQIEGAIDLRGKTSLRDAMALVKHANTFVGVVSFLSHVTNAFNKKGVVFFGPSSVAVWGHDNNINIEKKLTCAPCIDVLGRDPCPYDKLCMRLITVQEVREAIYKQIRQEVKGER